MNYSYSGPLTQQKLEQLLRDILKNIPGSRWLGCEIRVPNSRRRWDMAFELGSQTFIVEYDGDEHYRNSLKIKTDKAKDALAKSLGYKVIRVPYWIQMDSEMATHYFSINAEIKEDYRHGFIDTKIFPGSFCEKGIKRFEDELNQIPSNVKTQVVKSIKDRVGEHGIEYVLPRSLYYFSE